ncbi:hypothetical protein [Sneathiella sp. HT1-7]|jgi:hypothetical protein|uniref:hypothetical protein n=1 Tax=Sneathiella sp. HT1-7 TaxID=2887192 RepID=UPI001D1396BC|nr:hypothetical protein [Sneathiella sp. HT1-7]MCC3304924.1 hypothetical protein [Sneathiella sp. HT1-7]
MPKNVFDVAAFDLKARSEAGAPLTLRHPKTGEDLPAVIWLQGEDAENYRKCLRSQIDRQIMERKLELTAAELEERLIERLTAITLRFENIEFDGVSYDTTPENILRLYREHLWIREQVAAFVEDRANFLP